MAVRSTRDASWEVPFRLGEAINSTFREAVPCLSSDGKSLYFCSDRDGGHGAMDLWMSSLVRKTEEPWLGEMLTSAEWEWSEPVCLDDQINGSTLDSYPHVSADDLMLTFTKYRDGIPGISVSRRSSNEEPWGEAEKLPIDTPLELLAAPRLADDGHSITFSSGSQVGEDFFSNLFESHRIDDAWSAPTILSVSSASYDGAPYVTRDGLTILFHSFRSGGMGSADLWISQRRSLSDAWSQPEKLRLPDQHRESRKRPLVVRRPLRADFHIRPSGHTRRQ